MVRRAVELPVNVALKTARGYELDHLLRPQGGQVVALYVALAER